MVSTKVTDWSIHSGWILGPDGFANVTWTLKMHKEKQRGCLLLGANRYTHIYISYIYVYIYYLFVWDYSFEGLAPIISLFINYKYSFSWGQYWVFCLRNYSLKQINNIYTHIYSWYICVYIYLHQAEDNLFVSPCE